MGEWREFTTTGSGPGELLVCRGYFRHPPAPKGTSHAMRHMYAADFAYVVKSNRIIKNRMNDTETLFEKAVKYERLQYHSNEQVRKSFERLVLLAQVTADPEKDW